MLWRRDGNGNGDDDDEARHTTHERSDNDKTGACSFHKDARERVVNITYIFYTYILLAEASAVIGNDRRRRQPT